MHLDVGSYRITVPTDAVVVGTRNLRPTGVAAMVAKVGPFEPTAYTTDVGLEQWKDFVDYETWGSSTFGDLGVNGIPGLTIVPGKENTRRLEYQFGILDREAISIVAWAGAETTERERAAPLTP
jgi:hypothetical protein